MCRIEAWSVRMLRGQIGVLFEQARCNGW